MNEAILDQLELLTYADVLEDARNDFASFCFFWDKDFFENRPYLKVIDKAFQDIADGNINTLSISMPPRAGKSYKTSLFCAWMLGRNPTGSIMRNSCTTNLAHKFSYDVRAMVLDPRFKEVFPDIELSEDKAAVTGWNLQESEQVGYFCGGVGSNIIGFGCNLLSILDDPIKDVEEATSEMVLEKKWDWFNGVMRSRQEIGCKEIHIATRWSRRDIIGRLEAEDLFDRSIVVPAIIDGESFCEGVIPLKKLNEQKRLLPQEIWEAEYMQNPIEAKGLLYQIDSLKRFSGDVNEPDGIIAVVDTADTGSDYLSAVIGKLKGSKIFVDKVLFTRDPVEVTMPLLVGMLIDNKVNSCMVESNAGGRIFAKGIEDMIKERSGITEIISVRTTKNKETRMLMRSGFIKENMHFRIDGNSDYNRFLNQMTNTYKEVAKNKHDDAADSITMLAERVENLLHYNW